MEDALSSALRDPARLGALHRTALMDSPPEEAFDRLARMAGRLLDAPVAMVNLVAEHHQFTKACFSPADWGGSRETALADSLCRYAVASRQPLAIGDARRDPRVRSSALVTDHGLAAYVGIPLLTSDSQAIGTLCAADFHPREWRAEQIATLAELTAMVVVEIELRAEVRRRRQAEATVERKERFVSVLEAITLAAGRSADLGEALAIAVKEIGSTLRWPVGHAYVAGTDGGLVPSAAWYAAEERYRVFLQASEGLRLGPHQGLPGRVLATGGPAWIEDLSTAGFPRSEAAAKAGLRAGFAFPVRDGEAVLAVLEFYADRDEERDPALLGLLESVGALLGRVAERTRLEARLRNYARATAELQGSLSDLREHLETLAGLLRVEGDERTHGFAMVAMERVARLRRIEARLEGAQELPGRRAPVAVSANLGWLVRDAVRAVERELGRTRIELTIADHALPVTRDAVRLRELVCDLVQSAMLHSAAGEPVRITLRHADDGAAELEIVDRGELVPPAEIARLLARHHAVLAAYAEDGEGVRMAVWAEGDAVRAEVGALSALSRAGRGTEVSLRVPLAQG